MLYRFSVYTYLCFKSITFLFYIYCINLFFHYFFCALLYYILTVTFIVYALYLHLYYTCVYIHCKTFYISCFYLYFFVLFHLSLSLSLTICTRYYSNLRKIYHTESLFLTVLRAHNFERLRPMPIYNELCVCLFVLITKT